MYTKLVVRSGCLRRPSALLQRALPQELSRTLATSTPLHHRNSHDEPSTSDVEQIRTSETTTSKTTRKEERVVHPDSSIPHLDRPTQSEEMVHADRLPAHEDPLKAHKADSGAEEFSRSLWRKEEGRKELEGKTVEGKERSVLEEWELEDPQHPVKSGLPHLAKPSLSEEIVHADRFPEDPLADLKKRKKAQSGASTGRPGDSKSSIPVQPEEEVLSKN